MTPNRSMLRGGVGVLAVLSMGALASCGGDDDGGSEPTGADVSEPAPDDGSGDAGAGDDGDDGGGDSGASSDAGSADSGDVDFPIPAPDGLVLDALVDSGLDVGGQRQLYYANDDFDRVVAFYDDWTSQDGGEWFRGEAEGTVVFQDIGGETLRSITISPDHDPGAQADGPVTFALLVTDE